jgi:hypothetical protein
MRIISNFLLVVAVASTFVAPLRADLTITDMSTATAIGMANTIFGGGTVINSASYSGGAAQSGTFVTGPGIEFGANVLDFTEGVIFSTGSIASLAKPNTNTQYNDVTVDADGVDNDPTFNTMVLPATKSIDATWLDVDFTPPIPAGKNAGDIGKMTLQIVFGSEEYNTFVYAGFNDSIAIIVNGDNKALVPNGLPFGIDTINDAGVINPTNFRSSDTKDPNPEHNPNDGVYESANPSLYRDNYNDKFTLGTAMNGLTVTIPVTFDVKLGQSNTLKIGIADAADKYSDSWLFVKANSGQTLIVANNDNISTPANISKDVDVRSNDITSNGNTLSVTHILNQPIAVGQTITLAKSGINVKLNADGTLNISGPQKANDSFTYQVTDGNGGSSIAFVTVSLTDALPLPVAPIVVISEDTNGNGYIDSTELSGTIEVRAKFNANNMPIAGDTLSITDGNGDNRTIPISSTHIATGYIEVSFAAPASGSAITPVATITNAAGKGTPSTASATVIDTVIPTVIVTSDKNALKMGETARITFEVSEPSIFTASSATLTGGSLTGPVTQQGNKFLFTFTPNANSETTATILVANNGFTDKAGNANTDGADANNKVTISIDTQAPAVPTVISQSSNDTTPVITGTADSASTIAVTVDGKTYTEGDGNLVDNADGTWTLQIPASNPLSDGSHDVSIASTDAVGNVSNDITNNEVTIDTQAPALTANDVGPTNDTTPSITGTSDQPNDSIVTVVDNTGNAVCTATVIDGNWTCDATIPLSEGTNTLRASTIDLAGNEITTNLVSIIDSVPPTITIKTNVEQDSTLTVSGETESNATVKITFPDGTVKTVQANTNGHYSVTSDTPQPEGEASAIATDSLGNSTDTVKESFTPWYSETNINGTVYTYGDKKTPVQGRSTVAISSELIITREEVNTESGDTKLNVSAPTGAPAPSVIPEAPAGCDTQSYNAFVTLFKNTGEVETGYSYSDPACNGLSDATVYDNRRLKFVPGTAVELEKSTNKGGMVIIIDAELKEATTFGEK